jgi:sugar lactone lactonase YvrE
VHKGLVAFCFILGLPQLAIAQAEGNAAPGSAPGGRLASDRPIGNIEPVAEFHGAMPTGVTIAADGRIFVNFPRWGDDVPFTVGEVRKSGVVPYPDSAINVFDPKRPGETLGSVQSVVVDAANRLWILDTAAPGFSPPVAGGAKLVGVDLTTNKVVKTIVLSANTVLPTTYLNDVRFDLRQGRAGVAYITDSSVAGPGGIIVVDLDSGESWRKLSGHPSTAPDPAFVPIVEGEMLAMRAPGKPPQPLKVASDGIALSTDGATLYYCPLSSRHLYSVPTALLRIVPLPTPPLRRPSRTSVRKARRMVWKPTTRAACTQAIMRTTASAGARVTASGRRSRTIQECCGRTRSPSRRTDISISPPINCNARPSSTRAGICARSLMCCSA